MTDSASGERDPGLVVYTAVFGAGYELPTRPSGDGDAVCFTDREDLEPHGWTVRIVRPLLPADLPRSSREQKIRPHRWLPEHTRSLYVDPSVELRTDPEELWTELVGDDPATWFGALRHSEHETLLQEIDAVLTLGLDAPERVHEHLRALVLTERENLERAPVWGAILARRHHDPRCGPAMEDWYAQVLRYSRRDQISLPGVLQRAGTDGVRLVAGDNRSTVWHRWPRSGYSRPSTYRASATESLVPDVLRAEREAARAAALASDVRLLRSEVEGLRAELSRSSATAHELETVRTERDSAVRERERLVTSRTWRWTRAPRAASRRLRRG